MADFLYELRRGGLYPIVEQNNACAVIDSYDLASKEMLVKWFHDLKIASKLLVSFVAMLALTVVLGMSSIIMMARLNQASVQLSEKSMPSVQAILVLKSDVQAFSRWDFLHILSFDTEGMAKYEKFQAESFLTLKKNMDAYDRLISTPEEKVIYAEFSKLWDRYLLEHNSILALSKKNHKDEAKARIGSESVELLAQMTDRINRLVTITLDGGLQSAGAANDVHRLSRVWILGLLTGSVMLGLILALWVARTISQPLKTAVTIAKRVADGDLGARIEVVSKDETGQLMQALKDMNNSLQNIVGQVRTGTDTIATASSEIASGNLDLSSRTEQLASSLEETASLMAELTSSARQNTDNAHQANQLASSASDVAVKGGAVVTRVVETMGSINDSAKKIADIIGVIDGIAFQTNILALNAAVEAARAGEQGRGFAVVATEVRNLAQRSAASAREIKMLISDSVEQVDVGSRLVQQAGITMGEIVDSVQRVTDIMGDITSASQTQTSGIEQINHAISQMDQVTQQNAALVEEAAAAADAMQEQAGKLAHVVSLFKLEAGAPTVVLARTEAAQLREMPVIRYQPAL